MNHMILTMDGWKLIYNDYFLAFGFYFIQHSECKGISGVYGGAYCYEQLKNPCQQCGSKIPEGLQALFVLLTDSDMETP